MALGATFIHYTAKSVRRQSNVAPVDKSRNGFISAVTFLVVLLITGSIFYIGTHVKVVNLGYKINREVQRKETLLEENKRFSLEIATLKSPTRIEKEAREQLGLALPNPRQIVYLSRWEEASFPKETEPSLPLTAPSIETKKIAAQATPAEKPMKAQLPSVRSVPKIAVGEKTTKIPTSAKPFSKNKAPEVIVATLVQERPGKALAFSKGGGEKSPPVKSKEGVPAVMLDPMP